MRTTKAISVTLTHRQHEMVKAKVASGEYASESEVVREGLRALEERNAAVEDWLREAGTRRDDAFRADHARGKDAGETWRELSDHMDLRAGRRA